MHARAVVLALVAAVIAAAPVAARAPKHAGGSPTPSAQGTAVPDVPPAEGAAKQRLDTSPRHGELVSVDVDGKPVRTWIVYPQRKDPAAVVVLIHEIYGLSDWIRAVADQLAYEGYVAVVPDLLSGHGPNGGGTDAFPDRDAVTKAVFGLDRGEVLHRLDAVRTWAIGLPAATKKSVAMGFCWGGAVSFGWAAAQPALDGAIVYYGPPPPHAQLATIQMPVLGFYGAEDARVTTTVADTRAAMEDLGKPYEVHVYLGAGHGFLRAQDEQEGANQRAAFQAWTTTRSFLRARTRP